MIYCIEHQLSVSISWRRKVYHLRTWRRPSLLNTASNMPTLFSMLQVSDLSRLAASGRKRFLESRTLLWCRHLITTKRKFVTMLRRWWDESHSYTSCNEKVGCVTTSTICRICLRTRHIRMIILILFLNLCSSVFWILNLRSVKHYLLITVGISLCLQSGKISHTSMVACLNVMRKTSPKVVSLPNTSNACSNSSVNTILPCRSGCRSRNVGQNFWELAWR